MFLKRIRRISVDYRDPVVDLKPGSGQIAPVEPPNNCAAAEVIGELILKGEQQILISGFE